MQKLVSNYKLNDILWSGHQEFNGLRCLWGLKILKLYLSEQFKLKKIIIDYYYKLQLGVMQVIEDLKKNGFSLSQVCQPIEFGRLSEKNHDFSFIRVGEIDPKVYSVRP